MSEKAISRTWPVPEAASIGRFALTGGLSTVALFLLCWLFAAADIQASHAFITLFTLAPAQSLAALMTGGIFALIWGTVGGLLIAFIFNLTARLGQGSPR